MANETPKENLLAVLSSRRRNNARNQLRSVLLESYEIFGESFVEDVVSECRKIFDEFVKLPADE